jgi:uncharacterized protein YqeY
MTLKDIVYGCWKTAYKAGDSVIRSAYEQVKARIVNEEKSGKYELPLSDEIIQGCIQKVINELKESQLYYKPETESYQNVDIQLKELNRYLPKPLTDAEVIEMIKQAKAIESNPGKVIGIVAKQVGNRFDKSKIAGMVKNV